MPKTHVAERLRDVTDWSGRVLRKEILESIGIGCIVIVFITNVEKNSGEAPQSVKGQGWYNMGNSGTNISNGKFNIC